ncbi:MAG: hypothetical protein ACLVJ6_13500 [Merdibacter sp.]
MPCRRYDGAGMPMGACLAMLEKGLPSKRCCGRQRFAARAVSGAGALRCR